MRIVAVKNEQTGCLEVVGRSIKDGYPRIAYGGVERAVHRHVWMEKYGNLPPSIFVLHKCDNRRCINLDHLFLGTAQDNVADMVAKKRQGHGTKNGMHRLNEQEVIEIYRNTSDFKEIACKYGISLRQVYYIKEKKRWKILLNEL